MGRQGARAGAVSVVLGTALLAGCGTTHSSGEVPPETVSVSIGPAQVNVLLLQVGGPSGAKPHPIAGGQVQAAYQGAPTSRPQLVTTDRYGRASIILRPGQYLISGRESTADHFYCLAPAPVVVTGNSEQLPTSVTVNCIVP